MNPPEKINERRRFSRILIDIIVEFEHDNQKWQSAVIDISLKGILIEKPKEWQGADSDQYVLEVQLDPETTITMHSQVAHIDKNSIGFKCTMIDISSIAHLRRIVELNLDSTTLLERELHALGNPEE